MATTRIVVRFDDRDFKIRISDNCTVSQVMLKVRRYLKIKPEEALFMFWLKPGLLRNSEVIYGATKRIGEIKEELGVEPLKINLMRENAFGTWSKAFVKARIQERKGLFVSIITWSYYGIYHYEQVEIHNTLNEATEHLLKVRCDGKLSLESEKK